MGIASQLKRLGIGRPLRSDRLGETLLPKKLALPVFAGGALSSVASMITQVAAVVFGQGSFGFLLLAAVTALILVLAANTAFNGFPVLGSILARDGYLPRQLHTRGDRLAFSNGIVQLAGFACLLVIVFSAEVTRLIQLYIVGVFVSFVCSQTGMVRHWQRLLARERDPARRRSMRRRQAINGFGALLTGIVLCIVVITKFARGAWIVVLAMPVILFLMRAIGRHYKRVSVELIADDSGPPALPSRVHAIVLVSRLDKPTLRALAYARATHPHEPRALTVKIDNAETAAVETDWERRKIPVDLVVLDSPYREGDPARGRIRQAAAPAEPARRRVRLRAGIRRGALVGASAAQPERLAAQGPAAVAAGRDDDKRPVAAGVLAWAGHVGRAGGAGDGAQGGRGRRGDRRPPLRDVGTHRHRGLGCRQKRRRDGRCRPSSPPAAVTPTR